MIGVVIVTHSELAKDFVAAAENIVGQLDSFRPICLRTDESVESMTERIKKAVDDVSHGDGVIILTDMFGGTPSNIALTFHEAGEVEVVMGINLPMVLKLATSREGKGVSEVVAFITEYGKKNIQFASDILAKKITEVPQRSGVKKE